MRASDRRAAAHAGRPAQCPPCAGICRSELLRQSRAAHEADRCDRYKRQDLDGLHAENNLQPQRLQDGTARHREREHRRRRLYTAARRRGGGRIRNHDDARPRGSLPHACRPCGPRRGGHGDGGVLSCACPRQARADRICGRHLHKPVARTPRFPRHDGKLPCRQGKAV